LRINTEEMQVETLLDTPVAEAKVLMNIVPTGKSTIAVSKLLRSPVQKRNLLKVKEVLWQGYKIVELENGSGPC